MAPTTMAQLEVVLDMALDKAMDIIFVSQYTNLVKSRLYLSY